MERVQSDKQQADLLRGLAENDAASIEALYLQHFKTIRSLVLNNNGSAEEADDIFQEAMIVLYEKAKSEDFVLNCQIGTYLYSISRRLWLKRLQQMKRYTEINERSETVSVTEDLENHEENNQDFLLMEKSLLQLGEPCKTLLEAYYMQKRSMTEIAEDFGYTNADNAKNQKYKCLVRLKKLFFSAYNNSNKD